MLIKYVLSVPYKKISQYQTILENIFRLTF